MIRLAGLPFEVVPPEGLSPAERRSLARLPVDADPGLAAKNPSAASFVLELLGGPVAAVPSRRRGRAGVLALDEAPAAVGWNGERVTLRHRRLAADLDPLRGSGQLRRDASVGWPLEVTLRTALAARLPLEGGLPLHAAGLVVGQEGVAFFGSSGAGKSTLAAASPHPVLSDEMVAVVPGGPPGFWLTGTGFWGTFEGRGGSRVFPLVALVALERGEVARVDPLDPRAALRRLVAAALVPPAPPLWSAALGAIGGVVRKVPVFRLAWSPEEPWTALEEALRRAGALGA